MIFVKDNEIQTLCNEQVLTAGFVDASDTIDLRDIQSIALMVTLDINDSQDVFVKLVRVEGSNEYDLPLKYVAPSSIGVLPHQYKLLSNTDQKIMLDYVIDDLLMYGKIKVMATTVGATPGKVTIKLTYKFYNVREQ